MMQKKKSMINNCSRLDLYGLIFMWRLECARVQHECVNMHSAYAEIDKSNIVLSFWIKTAAGGAGGRWKRRRSQARLRVLSTTKNVVRTSEFAPTCYLMRLINININVNFNSYRIIWATQLFVHDDIIIIKRILYDFHTYVCCASLFCCMYKMQLK